MREYHVRICEGLRGWFPGSTRFILHCHTERQAKEILDAIKERLAVCKLRLNEDKTKVVHCQNYQRKKRKGFKKKFDFLGFTFKPRSIQSRSGGYFLGYDCSISQKAQTRIMKTWRERDWLGKQFSLQDIANSINIQMKGIITYYGKFNKWKLSRLYMHLGFRLVKWALQKYKRFHNRYSRGFRWLKDLKMNYPNLFYHWSF